uniref:Uncharacterized protein n=1 Tax=Daphnia magna TaxID=35525 RepID=A0A0P5JHN6_9CRUS
MKSTILVLLAIHGVMAFVTAESIVKANPRDIDLGESNYQCPDGLFVAPHETQCELYYLCSAGGVPTHLYQCRDDLLFDLTYYGCNFKELTDCGDRLSPFTCPSPDGFFPIKEGACSSQYYVCTNNVADLETCPSGIFDASSSSCVATSCATTTTRGVPTAPGPFECPAPNGNFASPYSCSQYYVCVDGTAFLYDCPSGLHYNPALNICDWPANVNCNL